MKSTERVFPNLTWLLTNPQTNSEMLAEVFVDECYEPIFTFSWAILGNLESASEAVVHAILLASKGISLYNGCEDPRIWVFRYASQAIDHQYLRQQRKHRLTQGRKKIFEIEENVQANEDAISNECSNERLVLKLYFDLPKLARKTVFLYYFFEFTIPEIAKILGIDEHSVVFYLHKTRSALRKELVKKGCEQKTLKLVLLKN